MPPVLLVRRVELGVSAGRVLAGGAVAGPAAAVAAVLAEGDVGEIPRVVLPARLGPAPVDQRGVHDDRRALRQIVDRDAAGKLVVLEAEEVAAALDDGVLRPRYEDEVAHSPVQPVRI